jgi:hypothetical protein
MPAPLTISAKPEPARSAASQVFGYALAIGASAALIWLARDTLVWCYGSWGCGTPCASSSIELLIAPVVLVLPFIKLLTAKGLSTSGLIARCAVTCGIGVWAVTIAVLFSKGSLL